MSLSRLNYLLMRDVLPFNFGMTYKDWERFWDEHPDMRGRLCPEEDPRTWPEDRKALVDRTGREEKELADRLMKLSDDEFYAEVDRLVPDCPNEPE